MNVGEVREGGREEGGREGREGRWEAYINVVEGGRQGERKRGRERIEGEGGTFTFSSKYAAQMSLM